MQQTLLPHGYPVSKKLLLGAERCKIYRFCGFFRQGFAQFAASCVTRAAFDQLLLVYDELRSTMRKACLSALLRLSADLAGHGL